MVFVAFCESTFWAGEKVESTFSVGEKVDPVLVLVEKVDLLLVVFVRKVDPLFGLVRESKSVRRYFVFFHTDKSMTNPCLKLEHHHRLLPFSAQHGHSFEETAVISIGGTHLGAELYPVHYKA